MLGFAKIGIEKIDIQFPGEHTPSPLTCNSIRDTAPAGTPNSRKSGKFNPARALRPYEADDPKRNIAPMFAALTLILGLGASAPAQMIPISYTAPDRAAVDSIKAGNHDCPHCMLAGANLDNTCVKDGNLEGADFSNVHAVLMCMSYANFTNVSFRDANLSGANLAHANLTGADFTGAVLAITSFKGTDLTKTKGLTQAQLDSACSDKDTKVPAGLKAHICT